MHWKTDEYSLSGCTLKYFFPLMQYFTIYESIVQKQSEIQAKIYVQFWN